MRFLLCLLVLVSCGKKAPSEEIPVKAIAHLDDLAAKFEEIKSHTAGWDDGWPSKVDCDGLLWAGLARAAGVNTKLSLAEYNEEGQMHRRPKPDCYPAESNSTISRDMILGYFWGLWVSKDWDALERFAHRADQKKWVIGEPYPDQAGEVLLNPNMIGLMGRMQCKGAEHCNLYKDLPVVHSKSDKDYVQHLTVLYIILNQQLYNRENVNDILQWHAERNPKDALFQFAYHVFEDGDLQTPTDLLLDPNYAYPSYVRGHDHYRDVHWLFVASLILSKFDLD